MEPDFLMMVLHGFLHGVGFVLALLLAPLFLGHPWAPSSSCWQSSPAGAVASTAFSPPPTDVGGGRGVGASRSEGSAEMSFKPEVQADETGNWYGNALRFATRAEAAAQVADLMMRWTAVRDTRVVESADPVNYHYVDGRLESVVPVQAMPVSI